MYERIGFRLWEAAKVGGQGRRGDLRRPRREGDRQLPHVGVAQVIMYNSLGTVDPPLPRIDAGAADGRGAMEQ